MSILSQTIYISYVWLRVGGLGLEVVDSQKKLSIAKSKRYKNKMLVSSLEYKNNIVQNQLKTHLSLRVEQRSRSVDVHVRARGDVGGEDEVGHGE